MDKTEQTIANIKQKFLEGWVVCSSLSGKDSMAVTHCSVEALRQAKAEDPNVGELYIVTTDTTIENPEISKWLKSVHEEAVAYGEENGLSIKSALLKPELLSQPLISYIGYGKLLRTNENTQNGRDCTIMWKIKPMAKFLNNLRKEYQSEKILSLSGVRDSESVIRAKNIAKRGETIDTVTKTDLGFTMAPIKNWSLANIWQLAGQIEQEEVESFAVDCIQGLFKNYSSSNGGTCDLFAGKNEAANKPCSARFGCYLCALVANDRSLEEQIRVSPESYGYMQGLNSMRRFMMNTLNDMEFSRSLLGRDEKKLGFLKVGWNQYSLEYRQLLLKLFLTLDAKEHDRAEKLGIEPKFKLIGYQELITIQYLWCKQGSETNIGSAFKIWHDVHNEGKYYDIPKTDAAKLKGYTFSFSEARFIGGDSLAPYRYVKIDDFEARLCALDNGRPGLEIGRSEFNPATSPRVQLDDGSFINLVPFKEGKRFAVVDEIAAERFVEETYLDLLDLGLDRHNEYEYVEPTDFLRIMLVRGIITLRKGQIKQLHKDARRAQLINAVNHAGRYFEHVFLAHSISVEEYKQKVASAEQEVEESMQMAMGF